MKRTAGQRARKKEKREQARLAKLHIEPGDILIYRISNTSARHISSLNDILNRLSKTEASLVILMEAGDTIETISQQLFQQALNEHIGEKAAQVVIDYANRARSRAS